jgi:uroporphyrinogen decarboxylase
MQFRFFDSWGGMLSPVDYQEFSWKYINQIIEALADHAPIVLEKDVGLPLMKWAKSCFCVRSRWTCSPMQDICPVEISLYRILIQDCCHLFR